MEPIAHKSRSFADAERWNNQQMWALTPEQRFAIAAELRRRAYGANCADVREAERRR
jgi:hypothetical protein